LEIDTGFFNTLLLVVFDIGVFDSVIIGPLDIGFFPFDTVDIGVFL